MINENPKLKEKQSKRLPPSIINSFRKKVEKVDLLLPNISLKETPTKSQQKTKGSMSHMDFEILSEDNKFIGSFTLTTLGKKLQKGKSYINGIKFEDEFRGKDRNYSKAVWLEIIKKVRQDNKVLFTGWSLTKGSDLVWQWLVENGYAKVTKHGSRNESNKGPGYSSYEYESL